MRPVAMSVAPGHRSARLLLAALLALTQVASTTVLAQTPPTVPDRIPPAADWGGPTRVDRAAPPKDAAPTLRPTLPAPGNPANTTVVPRSAPETKPGTPPGTQLGEVRLEAFLTDDGQRIDQGMVWHAFEDTPFTASAAGPDQRPKPKHMGTWKESSPLLRLAPGTYVVTATFGRAHIMRKVTVRAGTAAAAERFVLNAGALRISAQLANGEPIPEIAFGYDILAGDFDLGGGRATVLTGMKPNRIIRLNAGIYQIVSTYGDANSIVRADVTVEAGKLSETKIIHRAAKITFKLVNRPGGDAQSDTHWTIMTAAGDKIRDSDGALPSHILAAGAYEVVAKQGERSFKKSFIVSAGEPMQVEVVIPPTGR